MVTKIINIDEYTDKEIMMLYNDIPVIIPTETVYGLSASIYNEQCLKNIFIFKGRPQDNPLIVHVSSLKMLKTIVEFIPKEYEILMEKFWPGPLTLLFKPKPMLSNTIICNSEYIAIRMPNNKSTLRIIDIVGPLAAPSANKSGRPSPVTAQHAHEDMKDKVEYIVEGEMCEIGLESTILLINNDNVDILRPGGVSLEEIQECLNNKNIKRNKNKTVVVPGSKYKHYSPNVPVEIIKKSEIDETIANSSQNKIAVIMIDPNVNEKPLSEILNHWENNENQKIMKIFVKNKKDYQHKVFYYLRELEKFCDIIYVEEVDIHNEGLAIMDRLERAAKNDKKN
ncbi:SUA5 putative translation factor [Spraguea lophii 42_110]|uniref:Threonylcarbamoyl-AMP synthase n=1 Tax=Spraguea lophii (strain 42_110) TaxID=1358809 RepID=S7WDG8_SPRLO|nr:SUA5 putative translation factor [Spraguea lophii 42_110]